MPFLFGVPAFEKVAGRVIHWIFGRTGRHLFLTDDDEEKKPLLRRMVEDNDDCPFMYVIVFPVHKIVLKNYPSTHMKYYNHLHFMGYSYDLSIMLCAIEICRSALQSFKRRVTYSNVGYDRILNTLYILPLSFSFLLWIMLVFFYMILRRYCGLEDIIN